MVETDRQRLVHILGMLGSNSAGERENAALQAERLRRRLGKTWEDLVADRVVYVDCFIPPAPTGTVREVVREVRPAVFDIFPVWWIAVWCVVIGFVLGGWGHLIAICH